MVKISGLSVCGFYTCVEYALKMLNVFSPLTGPFAGDSLFTEYWAAVYGQQRRRETRYASFFCGYETILGYNRTGIRKQRKDSTNNRTNV